jgi:hypothetical protein
MGYERVMKDGYDAPAYTGYNIFDPGLTEFQFAVFSLQTNGSVYYALALGNIVMADGILQVGQTGPTMPVPGSEDSLSTAFIVGLAAGGCLAVAGVIFFVSKGRNENSNSASRDGFHILDDGSSPAGAAGLVVKNPSSSGGLVVKNPSSSGGLASSSSWSFGSFTKPLT